MITSKSFLKIVSIIKASAAQGLTLTQALPSILEVPVGRCDGLVSYRNGNGNEVCAYSNAAYALQVALRDKSEVLVTGDDEPTLAELMHKHEEFSVSVAKKNGRLFYELFSDGTHCSLDDILGGMDWFENDWIEVERNGCWCNAYAA